MTEPHLVQFNHQCDPEEATAGLPFVSIGSGQPTADPFLAFIRGIFWPERLPPLNDGIFATIWTLRHTIKTRPGGVGGRVQIVTLSKDGGNRWTARELSRAEFGEPQQMIQTMEEGMRNLTGETFSAQPTRPLPETPAD
jgi:hypothetical protein